uniref:Uncharacterized protein n=1 Tax=Setaria viridis TaxID=4556 RepID=A0A4U6W3E4_SETVI|nr:hypothetical protein SEVIR_2G141400v2 [Setaria viridis]
MTPSACRSGCLLLGLGLSKARKDQQLMVTASASLAAGAGGRPPSVHVSRFRAPGPRQTDLPTPRPLPLSTTPSSPPPRPLPLSPRRPAAPPSLHHAVVPASLAAASLPAPPNGPSLSPRATDGPSLSPPRHRPRLPGRSISPSITHRSSLFPAPAATLLCAAQPSAAMHCPARGSSSATLKPPNPPPPRATRSSPGPDLSHSPTGLHARTDEQRHPSRSSASACFGRMHLTRI